MTCFWDALRSRLNLNQSNKEFITYLKHSNKEYVIVLWNGESLSKKQMEENYEHVRDFNENSINNGYDCSICDPFLIMVCELYNVNINHNYNGYNMKYTKDNNERTLDFSSDTGHFR